MIVPNERWSTIMNIRILAASALTLATLTGAALAEPQNGNWDKCPGGFDLSTNLCQTHDQVDRTPTPKMTRSHNASAIYAPLSNQGSADIVR
jgi:hypothetical protein